MRILKANRQEYIASLPPPVNLTTSKNDFKYLNLGGTPLDSICWGFIFSGRRCGFQGGEVQWKKNGFCRIQRTQPTIC